ncbi:lipoprotein signal peptidase [Andreesenia angusta]|uniref:Lipoprotein signal peptidase n=1 Tax=Andreesenia angusta TaxID=39480 RepID=A0A1S1V7Q3_9FIRM|nr:signal peptidase II [Andreesenia angusta]OHW62628.1 lipoprotein signal peptidase [Andreesenia angusta]
MFFLSIILVVIDQVTKHFAVSELKGAETVHIIGEFLNLTYVENRGAAFGVFQDQRTFFILITAAVMIMVALLFVFKGHTMTPASKLSLYMIVGGALGNFIDRVRLGYVVDFIDVKFGDVYDFPVFNVADMALVIGTIVLMALIITDRYER